LIESGLQKGIALENLPTQKLYGVELNEVHYKNFTQKAIDYRLNLDNFWNNDIFFLPTEPKFDIIFGNPPWLTFANLPESYKETAKPLYFQYDLVGKAQDLLLGGSRIDIASLVIQKTIAENLVEGGEAIFFMPLSLLLNDGANEAFRTFRIHQTPYSLQKVYDFGSEKVFENVATRYGLVHFKRDSPTQYPVPYWCRVGEEWEQLFARPLLYDTAPLSITKGEHDNPLAGLVLPTISPANQPRQGINTCGANDVFFFHTCQAFDDQTYLLNDEILLPKRFIYPLIVGKNFQPNAQKDVQKWVLLPYKKNGKPLEWQQIEAFPLLKNYLLHHKNTLENRKGVMLQTWIKNGVWWAMLGVGAYNFAPFKVVWEAYGKHTFRPQIFAKNWQANQALQCFVPCESKKLAHEILTYLQNPAIETYLLSLRMEGTMNWAQAGKIKKLFHIA
jgi:hypothetical protein